MKIHHLNCGTFCPLGGRLIDGRSSLFSRAHLVCHCLLVEASDGLVLVDTGLGVDDVTHMGGRFPWWWPWMTGAVRRVDETALHQLRALGVESRDVRHIVLTHLDLDHAGGLPDFPDALVHVYISEYDAAMRRRTSLERHRYVPAQWEHQPRWSIHRFDGDRWMGFDGVRPIAGDDVVLIPLVGHTAGHCGVAVRGEDGWIVHAGDAFFDAHELDAPPRCPPGLRLFQRMLSMIERVRLQNQQRLRALAASGEVRVICSHSAQMYESFSGRNRSRGT